LARNLGQFRTAIRRYLKETNASTSYWDNNFLDDLFNAQYRKRSAQLIMAFEGWFVSVVTRDITADQARYDFPNGLQRVQKMELVREDGRTVPIMRFERHRDFNPASSNSGSSGESYLPNYRMQSNGFVLEPTPAETVTNGLQLEYAGVPTAVATATDYLHPSWPEMFEELLILDTAVACFDAEGNQESGLVRSLLRQRMEWEEQFERFIEQRTIGTQEVEPFIVYGDA
jgi:hypothetical protein